MNFSLQVEVGPRQIGGSLLDAQLQILVSTPNRVGHLALQCDVLRDAEEERRSPFGVEQRNFLGVQPPLAVRREDGLLRHVQRRAATKDLAVFGLEGLGLFARKEVEVSFAQQLRARRLEERLPRAVNPREAKAIRLLHEDHVRNVLDDRVEKRRRLMEPCLVRFRHRTRPFVLLDPPQRLLERPLHAPIAHVGGNAQPCHVSYDARAFGVWRPLASATLTAR